MNHMRVLQRTALAQLFEARPTILRQQLRQLQQTSQQPFRTRPLNGNAGQRSRFIHTGGRPITNSHTSSSHATPNFTFRSPHSQRTFTGRGRRWNSSSSSSSSAGSEGSNLTLSQRLKKLSREYGWSALGVYFLLTALDFPFCFLAVRLLGTDRIGHWEHVILESVKSVVKWPLPHKAQAQIDAAGDVVEEAVRIDSATATQKRVLEENSASYSDEEVEDHGYKEAEKANKGPDASLWTQLALAYAIHKSFIFIRVPLTVSITPKVVKTLRSWGWNIGKVPSRKGAQGSTSTGGSTAGVNTKGSKVKPDD